MRLIISKTSVIKFEPKTIRELLKLRYKKLSFIQIKVCNIVQMIVNTRQIRKRFKYCCDLVFLKKCTIGLI